MIDWEVWTSYVILINPFFKIILVSNIRNIINVIWGVLIV